MATASYIRINLTTYDFTAPAPLPGNLVGLQDESLADLSAALEPAPDGLAGIGYWPVVETDVMEHELDGEGQRYLIPLPPAPPVPVPLSITMRQAKLMLHRAGLLPEIEEQIATMPGDDGEVARIEWTTASVLERDHPLIAVMGVPDEQVDSLFTWASAL